MRAFVEKHKYLLSALFFILLIYITGTVIFKQQSFSEIVQTIKLVNPYYLLLGVGMMGVFAFCETVNMHLLFKGLNQRIPFFRCIEYVYVGFYFASITPASLGGQPMQMYYMSKDKINVSVSSLVILLYFVVYQFVLLLFCGIMYIANYAFIHVIVYSIRFLLFYGICASLFLISFVLFVFFSKNSVMKVINGLVNFLAKIRIVKDKDKTLAKAHTQMDEYVSGVEYLKTHLVLLGKLCCVTFMQYMAFFSVPYCVYRSFGLKSYSYFNLVAAQSMIHLSAASLPIPGAVGAAENSFYLMFEYIYPKNMVVPAMLLSRGISFYGFMIFSGIITLLVHIRTVRARGQKINK